MPNGNESWPVRYAMRPVPALGLAPCSVLHSGLKRRCDGLQVLSHQLAVASWEDHLPKPRAIWAVVGQLAVASWEDHLPKPRTIWAVVGVKGCRPVSMNIFQS